MNDKTKKLTELHKVRICATCGVFRKPGCYHKGTEKEHQICDEVKHG